MARRRGRIARLPKDVRDVVNKKLQDGVVYREIAEWLVSQGHADMAEHHVQVWYQGGYADWLKEQKRNDEILTKREFAMDFLKLNEGGTFQEASLQLAASQLYDMLREFNPEVLKTLMHEKPEVYVRMVNALSRMSRGALNLEALKDRVRDRLGQIAKNGAFTEETIRRMEEALNLL
jgi:hypothetical protein